MFYEKELNTAIEAALEAGELLRTEFHRPGGPRGEKAHAEADEIAEWKIRKRLLEDFPAYRYRGEETGSVATEDRHVWLVDPHDGTSGYLRGARGSSVSIGLVREGLPVLGVVYAFCAPDDRGDLICWAEGCQFTRNSLPVQTHWDISHKEHIVLLLTTHREWLIPYVLDSIKPYRYRTVPSIAYRLALVAAGDGIAAVSWHNPGDWDYAGGHALIRAAGGSFVNEHEEEITYAPDGCSKVKRCFGGHPEVVHDLLDRDWHRLQGSRPRKKSEGTSSGSLFSFARLNPGISVSDPERLSRAQGCLLGQVAGDALGQTVEFSNPEAVRARYPGGLNQMHDGGFWNTIAGQPTDDSELALLLARSIVNEKGYDPEKVAAAYSYWFSTDPFDIGQTTSQAMSAVSREDAQNGTVARTMASHASRQSQANGSLMRISPLGIYGWRKTTEELWELACAESRLTHPHIVCQHSCALFTIAIAAAIREGSAAEKIYDAIVELSKNADASVKKAIQDAAVSPPDYHTNKGWVLVALQNAFFQLLHASNVEEGIVQTVNEGDDSDTNAAIAGALLGAVYGREEIPFQWRQMILSCRPHSIRRVVHPRPYDLWPLDTLTLAELLLLCD
jgi:ADP-ribosylglycohydrolase/fructose-1,6-bisphosphatase/inositol monophosphatase family enzyme